MDAMATRAAISKVPVWYVLILAVLVGAPPVLGVYGHAYGYSPDLHTASIIQVGSAGILALFLFLQSGSRRIPLWYGPVLFPALLFYAWALLSLLWAHNYYEGAVKLLDWGGALLLGFLISQSLREERHVRLVLQGIFFAGALLLMLGLAQYFFDVDWVDQHAKPAATFNNKNMAAQYTLLIFPLCVALVMYSTQILWKLVFAFFGFIALFFILTSDTRGSIIAASVEVLLLMLLALYKYAYDGERRKVFYVLLFTAVGIGLLIASLFLIEDGNGGIIFFRLVERFTQLYNALVTFTGETRFQIWLNTIAMIADRPLIGFGVGNWMVEYPLYHMKWRFDREMSYEVQHINTHQDYLELTAELGLIGMFFLLWMGVQVVRVLFNVLRRIERRDSWLVLGAGAAMVGMAVNALGSFPFEQPVPVMLFMVYGGALDFYYRKVNDRSPAFHLPAARIARPAAIVSVLLCVGLLVLHYRWYNSEIHFRRATIASHQQNYYLTLLHGKEALRWSRGRKRMANFIAVGHMQRGEVARAIEAWEDVLGSYPNLMHTLNNTSIAYARLGNYEKALEKAEQLVELRATPKSFVQKASVLQALGRLEEAEGYFRKALEPGRRPALKPQQRNSVLRVLGYMDSIRLRSEQAAEQEKQGGDAQPLPVGPPLSGS